MDDATRFFGSMALLLVATFCFYRALIVWDSQKVGAGLQQAFLTAVIFGSVATAYFMLYPPG